MTQRKTTRRSWPDILDRGRAILAASPDAFTLRQLFYRLVAQGVIPNTTTAYKQLSDRTAVARRAGEFPALVDRTRRVENLARTFTDPADARKWLATIYRLDRTEGQPCQVILGVEKDTLAAQVSGWFSDYDVPVIVLRGYGSQTYIDRIADLVDEDDRETFLIYAGDFDPTGEDILRDLLERVPGIDPDNVLRVAVTPETIATYDLPEMPGKTTDSRAAGFEARYGKLVQVEVEALDPADLRELFTEAFDEFWDMSSFEAVKAREAADAKELAQ